MSHIAIVDGPSRDDTYGSSDTETVRDAVMYDVVDPDSICDPMGNPA